MSPENSLGSSAPTDHARTAGVSRDVRDEVVAAFDEAGLYLVVTEGRDSGQWIELGQAPVTGGRDSHLDLVIADNDVSRLHILVSVIDGTVVVEDLGSTNGTFVDGQRIVTRAPLPVGSVLRVGDHVLRCERCNRREVERGKQRQRDLERATGYVLSLLPPPAVDGPLRTEWLFLPSARLGGDALGYEQLDSQRFVIYLLDVSGHGVGAAMHSVSVLNVLRQRALSHADFTDPVQVLTSLNAMFQMDRHDDQCFTMWYGVYDIIERTLTYASAGHHPGYLVPPTRLAALPLRTPGPIMGAKADAHFSAQVTSVPVGSSLYLFSDGAFEILTKERQWRLQDFLPLLLEPPISGIAECQRIYQAVKSVARFGQLEDDFSLLVVTFP